MKTSRLNARSQITKKSFGPTFAEKSAEDEMDMSDSSTESKQKKKKKQTGKQSSQNTGKGKRRHSQTDQTTSSLTGRTKCRACKQGHDFCVCYYLFPNKASDWFTPNTSVKQQIEQNLKDDNDLAEKIKWLQKSMNKTRITEVTEKD